MPTAVRGLAQGSDRRVLSGCAACADDKGDFRYAEGKWSVKELIGHMADAERVFGYRLLRIARADKTPLAGFDENAWAKSRRTASARSPMSSTS